MASIPWKERPPTERWAYQKERERARVEKRQLEQSMVIATAVERDPCFGCAVPAHQHDEHGCARYIRSR